MAGVAETQRATKRGREGDPKAARGSAAAVVAGLLPKPLELDRAKPLGAHRVHLLDLDDRRQVRPSLEFLAKDQPRKVARRGVIFRPVSLPPPPLRVSGRDEGRGRLPDRRFAEEGGPEVI